MEKSERQKWKDSRLQGSSTVQEKGIYSEGARLPPNKSWLRVGHEQFVCVQYHVIPRNTFLRWWIMCMCLPVI